MNTPNVPFRGAACPEQREGELRGISLFLGIQRREIPRSARNDRRRSFFLQTVKPRCETPTLGAKRLDVLLPLPFQIVGLFLHAGGFLLRSLYLFQPDGFGNGDPSLSIQLFREHDKREGI